MARSKASICNDALGLLGQPPLVSDPDDVAARPHARSAVEAYDRVLDEVLADGLWSFARRRVSLEVDATAPDFGWAYRYGLPSTPRYLAPVGLDPDTHGADAAFEIESGWILTDESGPLNFVYVGLVDDPNLFEPNFAASLALKIAARIAPKVLNSQEAADGLEKRYRQSLPTPRALERRNRRPTRLVGGGDWLPRSTG